MKPEHRSLYVPPDPGLYPGVFPLPHPERVQISGAPAHMHGLRALFVSDVHLRRSVSDARLEMLIGLMRMQRADLLLLGGDYAEDGDSCARFFAALRKLSFPLGAYAVPGNNDPGDAALLQSMMARAGVTLLKNRCASIRLPGGTLEIAGCDEHKYGAPRTDGLFSGDSAYRILLSHFPILPDCACELMLSGHTHGGQFNLMGVTPYTIGFERRFPLLAVRGLHRIGEMQLLVSSGVGVSRLPLRIGASPRIHLLEFCPEVSG